MKKIDTTVINGKVKREVVVTLCDLCGKIIATDPHSEMIMRARIIIDNWATNEVDVQVKDMHMACQRNLMDDLRKLIKEHVKHEY